MNEFVFIFRRDCKTESIQPSAQVMQDHLSPWQTWFKTLEEQNRFTRPLQRIDQQGRISRQYNSVQTGPYSEANDSIRGVVFIQAKDYDEAVELVRTCPILELDVSVEIRQTV